MCHSYGVIIKYRPHFVNVCCTPIFKPGDLGDFPSFCEYMLYHHHQTQGPSICVLGQFPTALGIINPELTPCHLYDAIYVASMMLSGVFFSVNNLPTWLANISRFLPLTALNNSLRKIALEGLSIKDLGFEMSVMAVYLLISTLLTVKVFKWY